MQNEAPLMSRTAPQILCQATLLSGEVFDVITETSWTAATECAYAAACGNLLALGDDVASGSIQLG
eukprot:13937447-Ditylum_brightwellii.AAC.1